MAREAGAITLADNTFLSPAQQRPLDLGCDLVCHSTTKYLNGHSDVVGGVIAARNAGLGEELAWWANATGVTGAPFDSYQTLRGLRTLFVRIKQAAASAQAVAAELAADDRVERVYFPGLESHEGHALACRQQTGFGAMLSVEFAENVDVIALLRGLNLFTTAESLGGFESLACIPALMTHASMDAAARAEAGISDGLVRLSIGLEDPADLLADLDRALGAACAAPSTPKARVAA